MKKFISGVLVGIILAVEGVFASEYVIYPNPYKILVDGNEKQIEAYNINDKTYLQLRDISKALGNVTVDFKDDTIILETNNTPQPTISSQPDTSIIEYTSDGIPVDNKGDEGLFIHSPNIERKMKSIGLKEYSFWGSRVNEGYYCLYNGITPVLDNIPVVDGLIPLDYYENTLKPFIEGLAVEE